MNVVLDWVKKNVFIVVFVVLMLAALTTLPIISSGLNAGVQQNVKKRASKASAMSSLTTELSGIPGLEPTRVVVNERLLEQYERAANAISEDATRVVAAAIAHNRKDRGVLMPQLLPKPPMELQPILP